IRINPNILIIVAARRTTPAVPRFTAVRRCESDRVRCCSVPLFGLLPSWSRAFQAMVDDVLLTSVRQVTPPDDSPAPLLYYLSSVVLKDGRLEQVALDPVEGL